MRVWLFLWCAATLAGAEPAIQGIVVDADSGKPVPQVSVHLRNSFERNVNQTTTDDAGRFQWRQMAVAVYGISASKAGYVDLLPSSAEERKVVVEAGSHARLRLALTRTATITGRVFDTYHRPVPGTIVAPIRKRIERGHVRFVPGTPAATVDGSGMFQLTGLAPGRYTFAALPPPAATDFTTRYPVYFPDVVEFDKAEPMILRAGEIRSPVEFLLFDDEVRHTIAGQIKGLAAGWGSRRLLVSLFSQNGYAGPLYTKAADAGGYFEFPGIPGGSYTVVAADTSRYGGNSIELTGRVNQAVQVAMTEGAALEGNLTFEPGSKPDPGCFSGAAASLEPVDPVPPWEQPKLVVSAKGDFRSGAVPAIHYRASLSGLRRPCLLDVILVGSRISEDRIVDVDGTTRLTMVLTTRGARAFGMVVTRGTAEGAATVILAPAGPNGEIWPEKARIAATGSHGSFQIEGLGPGWYRGMAIPDLQDANYLDPLFWSDHKEQTVEVVISTGAAVRLELPLLKTKAGWR